MAADPATTLRALFDQAVEQPQAKRAAWLDAHCPEPGLRARLERLLAADAGEAGGVPTRPAPALAAAIGAAAAPRDTLPPGTRIAGFVLDEPLGSGGFANVYRAHRTSAGVRQQVALKLLHRGLHTPDAQRQFRREREALARLEHPNIARLVEGGVTEQGLAYIALELVDGEPITAHARRRGLALRDRIALVLQVCRAVEAAHRALLVHRDLKPSNVLVTAAGSAKLLDFGIAKALAEDETGTQVPAFTPAYAAPEQREGGAITTATDVYALGVLLGELLTGRRLDAASGRASTLVTAQRTEALPDEADVPLPPAALARALRGDLDRVLAKALARDPAERYASAGALADDLERWLAGRPVAAHPPSAAYRARKFVRRHRYGVAAGVVLVAAVLAALALALAQARLAREEAARANAVRELLLGVFDAARAELPREARISPEALVESARGRLAASGPLDAATRAELLETLGEVELSMAQHARAADTFAAAAALLAPRASELRRARLAVLRADALQRAGRNGEARTAIDAELAALRRSPSPLLLRALAVRAAVHSELGVPAAALADLEEAEAAARRVHASDAPEAIAASFALGNGLARAQRYPEAATVLEAALSRWRAAGAPEDARYAAALSNLAVARDGVGDLAGAEAQFEAVLALKQRIYTAPHGAIATTLRDLAVARSRAERHDEAEATIARALEMDRAVYGPDHREVAADLDILGNLRVARRRFAEADQAYRDALAVCARAAIREEVCTRARNNLGMSLYCQDRLDEAEREMAQALDERRALFGHDHPTVAYSLSTLANVAAKRGDGARAMEHSAAALAVLERAGRAASREAALIRNGHAQALHVGRRHDEALHEIGRALADWRRVAPDSRTRHVQMLVLRAEIQRALADEAGVRATIAEALALGVPEAELPEATRALIAELGRGAVTPP